VIRSEQNWIGGAASSPRDAEFVPPPPELVPDLLDDLCAFCNREDVPASVQAGIAHAQFETIHPFADGNGRVGRALIHVVLRRRALAPRYVPPVSLVLAADASPRTREKVERLARARRVPVLMGPVAERLGAGLGRPPVQAVGVADAALARGLVGPLEE